MLLCIVWCTPLWPGPPLLVYDSGIQHELCLSQYGHLLSDLKSIERNFNIASRTNKWKNKKEKQEKSNMKFKWQVLMCNIYLQAVMFAKQWTYYLDVNLFLRTCKCHADMLIQRTDLTYGPFLLQLCNRFLLHPKDYNVFTPDSHLHGRKKININFEHISSIKCLRLADDGICSVINSLYLTDCLYFCLSLNNNQCNRIIWLYMIHEVTS